MDLDEAVESFRRATRHCDNLVTVHRGHGGPLQGRRDEEVSINRAVVVLTVASWQAVIQDFTLACLDLSMPAAGSPLSPASYNVLAGRIRNEVGSFATPNAQNVRKLLVGAGFDPRPFWAWSQMGGRGQGTVTRSPADADARINEWLLVRHAIAHGHAALPAVNALQAVRLASSTPPTDPQLRLVDAEQCLAFFRRLARLTGVGLAGHLGVAVPRFE
jgi:hypothetical protein